MIALDNLFRFSTDFQLFSAGQTIFNQGDPGAVMYVVLDGQVDILLGSQLVETVDCGGILGELSLIDNRPRAATAIAHSDVRLVPIDRERFTFMVDETPFFAAQVMEAIAQRLRRMDAMASQRLMPYDYSDG
ncbi:MAG: cyclic nucleotide-binding domain-containing protein [Anaerolineae bacterium]|nr:cyclic nucleotide-binding domain-containing protein [Anaerolineae bacterium]